jgi:DNA-directed RNA polymerase specialized sigma24 family protein
MQMAKVLDKIPDGYVPTDLNDLVRVFTPYVVSLITRNNRVATNFEDILQHVWLELVRVDVVNKYRTSAGSIASRCTAEQAASYLQVTWQQWKVMMWRAHGGGDMRKKKRGDTTRTQTKKFMPEPVDARGRPLWVPGSEAHRTKAGWSSKKTLFEMVDIEKVKLCGTFAKTHSTIEPVVPRTRGRFKMYLASAVHNIFSNWCRTRSRRYKDIYLAPLGEEEQAWESMVVDETSCRQQATAEVARVVADITRGVKLSAEPLLDFVGKDKKLSEAGKAEIGALVAGDGLDDHERVQQVFLTFFAEGLSLKEVVAGLALPKSVLKSVGKWSGTGLALVPKLLFVLGPGTQGVLGRSAFRDMEARAPGRGDVDSPALVLPDVVAKLAREGARLRPEPRPVDAYDARLAANVPEEPDILVSPGFELIAEDVFDRGHQGHQPNSSPRQKPGGAISRKRPFRNSSSSFDRGLSKLRERYSK